MFTGPIYAKLAVLGLACVLIATACQPAATPAAATATVPPPTATSVPPTTTPAPATATVTAPTVTPAAPTATAEPTATPVGAIDTGLFAGRWTGTMYAGGDPDKPFATVTVSILPACAIRTACGQLSSADSGCRWELRLLGIDGDVLEYAFSQPNREDCTLGAGTLTLQTDGTLLREHVMSGPGDAGSDRVSGPLTRVP